MDKVKLALAADVHLGSSFNSFPESEAQSLRDAQEQSLANLCYYCQRQEITLLFLAGDLFDHTNPDKALLRRTQQSFALCPETEIYLVPGNHDPYFAGSIWDVDGWPDNTHVAKETGTCWQLPGRKLRIYSEPFVSQSASQSLVTDLQPNLDPSFFNILLLHGDLVSDGSVSRYNPISQTWLADSGLDLAILGHHHDATDLVKQGATRSVYPGALMGRGFDELGSKGFYAGTIAKRKELYATSYKTDIQLKFVPLKQAAFFWENIELSTNDQLEYNAFQQEILSQIRETVQLKCQSAKKVALRIDLSGRTEFAPDLTFLNNSLASSCLHLEFLDKTRRPLDLKKLAASQGLKSYAAKLFDNLEKDITEEKTILSTPEPELIKTYQALSGYDSEQQYQILDQAMNLLFTLLEQGD
ncbi:MAG: DNA repair exonuclease [Eubacteriales bacterium]|nr:DNA repair exonuclease [Eubacteriales bacterium]